MKTSGLRERNKADKLERIKASAKRLFDQKGYDLTTTKEIADAAGVATGTVFLYAKTKDEILDLIFEEEIAHVRNTAFSSINPDASLVDASYSLFSGLLMCYNDSPELARALIRRFILIDPSMSERMMSFQHETFEQLARLVITSQARGETRADLDPLSAVSTLWAVYSNCLVFFLQTKPLNIETALTHLRISLELLFSGLAPVATSRLDH